MARLLDHAVTVRDIGLTAASALGIGFVAYAWWTVRNGFRGWPEGPG